MISLQCLKCWQTIMMYFSSPPPFFLTLSQWVHILSSLLRHLPWPLWYSLLMTLPIEKTETIRKDSPQKTWHHINLPVDISVQILSHLLLPIYYCEWTVLYGQGQPIHPCSRSHLLSSLSFQLMAFIFFLITGASSNNNTKTAFVWGPKV